MVVKKIWPKNFFPKKIERENRFLSLLLLDPFKNHVGAGGRVDQFWIGFEIFIRWIFSMLNSVFILML